MNRLDLDYAEIPSRGKSYVLAVDRGVREDLRVHIWDMANKLMVTGRTMKEYRAVIPVLNFLEPLVMDGKNFVEVGGGLSEFTPHQSRILGGTGRRPLLIDPLPYETAKQLLESALLYAKMNRQPFAGEIDRIQHMLDNCRIITDPTKVDLLNCTLGEAIQHYPTIHGSADAVIDLFGPCEYPYTESAQGQETVIEKQRQLVIEMQRLLLKKDGLLLNAKNIT